MGNSRGFASAEAIVGTAVAFAVILASLSLVRGTCRLGARLGPAADRAVAAEWALEQMAADLEQAWTGVPEGGVDEGLELVLDGAIGVRADFDGHLPDEALEPESEISPAGGQVTTGNDEVFVYLRRRPDDEGGVEESFLADMDGPDTVTLEDGTEAAVRDGVADTVDVGRVLGPDDERPASLYRVSFVHHADRFGTTRFRSAQPLLDGVTGFRVRVLDRYGAELTACGGGEGTAARACRAAVRRVVLELALEGSADVFRRDVRIASPEDSW